MSLTGKAGRPWKLPPRIQSSSSASAPRSPTPSADRGEPGPISGRCRIPWPGAGRAPPHPACPVIPAASPSRLSGLVPGAGDPPGRHRSSSTPPAHGTVGGVAPASANGSAGGLTPTPEACDWPSSCTPPPPASWSSSAPGARWLTGGHVQSVEHVRDGDHEEQAGEPLLVVVFADSVAEFVWHRVAAVGQPGDRFSQLQGSELGVGEVRRLSPGGDGEEALVALARLLGLL